MKTISTREELDKLVDANRDLTIDDDVLIEFSLAQGDVRDVKCRDLILKKGDDYLDFTGGNFNGRNFTGGDFIGWNISYHAFFCLYGRLKKHGKITARHENAHPIIELGKLEVK